MKYKLKTFIISAVLAGLGSFAVVLGPSVTPAFAVCEDGQTSTDTGPANDGDCAEQTSFTFGKCGKDQVGIECLADEILTFLSILVGIAVVAGITVGGIVYSMAKGNPANAQKGIKIITNAVVGLILYLLMFAIINFLVPGGILFAAVLL